MKTAEPDFSSVIAGIQAFISHPTSSDRAFNDLALHLFTLQSKMVPVYRAFCQSQPAPRSWQEIPALPISAFKQTAVTSLPEHDRSTVFMSSGTTNQNRSRHYHNAESVALYETSVCAGFQKIRDEIPPLSFVFLTPSPATAPNSSLVHMFETLRKRFGTRDSSFLGTFDSNRHWHIDGEKVASYCKDQTRPVAVMGTAFNFVHLLEGNLEVNLPAGSIVLETGGYKGQSRAMPRAQLYDGLEQKFGVPPSRILSEYGMCELSSQAYNLGGLFRFPPWARFRIVSPENGKPIPDGEPGLLQILDLANVRSVFAIQTEDLAVAHRGGFELRGRASMAEPRGCSLMTA